MGGQKTGNRAACLEARKARRDVKVAKIEKIKFCILSTCWPLQASLAEVHKNTLILLKYWSELRLWPSGDDDYGYDGCGEGRMPRLVVVCY